MSVRRESCQGDFSFVLCHQLKGEASDVRGQIVLVEPV